MNFDRSKLAGYITLEVLRRDVTRESPDREKIEEAKNACAGCGAELVKVGPIEGEKRGEAFECSRESCGYREHRLYGESYDKYAKN